MDKKSNSKKVFSDWRPNPALAILLRRHFLSSEQTMRNEDRLIKLEEDIQMLVRRHFELTEAKDRLERLSREKSEFLSIVAHQFRTPLTGIKWPLSVILRNKKSGLVKKNKQLIEEALNSAERMISLVNDFLNVVRIEEGRLVYYFKLNDVKELLEQAAVMFSVSIREKKIDFRLNLEPPTGLKAVFDRDKMLMVIQNVLENAFKFTPQNGRISCNVRKRDNEILFSVSDSGIGIPKEEHNKIFQKFGMASNALSHSEGSKGTGLGLYLAKSVVEQHGGRIWFRSREGEGTTFFFTLPIKKTRTRKQV